jgi:nucleoside-triphosphatase
MKFFLTGLPGSGKSTVFLKCVERLRGLGFTVGGIATPEIRSRGRRVGFSVVDLATGRRALLAGVEVSSSFRVGRYGVELAGFESVALPALDYAEESCDVVCIDEIGRMELFSRSFKRRVEELIKRPKPMVSVLHRNYAKVYGGWGTLLHVSHENRGQLPQVVVSGLERYLKQIK